MHMASFVVTIEVLVDLSTLPYRVMSGSLHLPGEEVVQWAVTDGMIGVTAPLSTTASLLSDQLFLRAEWLPLANEEGPLESATTDGATPIMELYGNAAAPNTYQGAYASSLGGYYLHATLFRGWQRCT
jgi:hypothetical protein